MYRISVETFRTVLYAALALDVCLVYLTHSDAPSYSDDILTARQWNGYESHLPLGWLWLAGWFFWICRVAAFVGLWWLLPFARSLLAAQFVAATIFTTVAGLVVVTPIEHFASVLSGAATLWLLFASYWSPLANRFRNDSASEPG